VRRIECSTTQSPYTPIRRVNSGDTRSGYPVNSAGGVASEEKRHPGGIVAGDEFLQGVGETAQAPRCLRRGRFATASASRGPAARIPARTHVHGLLIGNRVTKTTGWFRSDPRCLVTQRIEMWKMLGPSRPPGPSAQVAGFGAAEVREPESRCSITFAAVYPSCPSGRKRATAATSSPDVTSGRSISPSRCT
jgi:hypothetical protein